MDNELVKEDINEQVITSAICIKLKHQPKICDRFAPGMNWIDTKPGDIKITPHSIFYYIIMVIFLLSLTFIGIKYMAKR